MPFYYFFGKSRFDFIQILAILCYDSGRICFVICSYMFGLLHNLPSAVVEHLTSTGSLTARLEKLANKPISVKVLSDRIVVLSYDQKIRLGLPKNRPALARCRQVMLYGDDEQAWIKAISFLPLSSLTGELKRLKQLGDTPIGYVLFKKNRTLPHCRHYYQNNDGIGRSTLYQYRQRPILIDEIFLPTLIEKLTQTKQNS